jgi:hypothetical protein
MCAGCAMTAMAGASGVRSWLQTRGWTWLTPARLRRATIGVFVAAVLVSTVGLSGSTRTSAGAHHVAPAPAATAQR